MSIFTEAAMMRPLFEEPSDTIERTDPWSGPQGFMIGAMALPTKAELGQQYFDAATILVSADGEIYVDLGNLQAVMTALNAAFVHMRATLRTRMGVL